MKFIDNHDEESLINEIDIDFKEKGKGQNHFSFCEFSLLLLSFCRSFPPQQWTRIDIYQD